jgi:hypothetical protein
MLVFVCNCIVLGVYVASLALFWTRDHVGESWNHFDVYLFLYALVLLH